MTLDELCAEYSSWAYVFGEKAGANCTQDVEGVGGCPTEPCPSRADVAEIIASCEGENDGDSWAGLFVLKDGRFLYAEGWCDYTGWG